MGFAHFAILMLLLEWGVGAALVQGLCQIECEQMCLPRLRWVGCKQKDF